VKILLIAPQPFYQERGTPIAVRLIAETLCDFGHEVDLLAYHEGSEITYPGLRLFRAGRPPGVSNVPIGISPQKIICDVWLIARMVGLMRRTRYDVIHAVEESIFPAALITSFTRQQLVFDMDSSLADQLTDKWRFLKPLRRVFEWIERSAIGRSHLVLTVCEDLAVKVRPWVGEKRTVVLPDVPVGSEPTDDVVDDLRKLVGEQSILCLYVGNLEKYQGIDLMLEAFARVEGKPTQLVIIGGQPADVARYEARSAALRIGHRVRFLGPRPVNNLNAYLTQADILISPRTKGQNTPMKVYSYMHASKAILATDIRSHTQALDPTCAVLTAATPPAFAEGLQRLASDPELRKRLGAASCAKVESEYSVAIFKRKLQHAYGTLKPA